MHILIGALVGLVVSVALTYAASLIINKPITWKDLTASAVAGLIGGAVATATLGVGAATTARMVVGFAAGGATGSSSGQLTDNVLHGHPAHEGVLKATALGTVIGAGTLGAGKLAAPVFKHVGRMASAAGLSRGATSAAASGAHGPHSNAFAGAAAGLDDAIVPVARYVKKALNEDEASQEEAGAHGQEQEGVESSEASVVTPVEPPQAGMLDTLTQSLADASAETEQQSAVTRPQEGWGQRLRARTSQPR